MRLVDFETPAVSRRVEALFPGPGALGAFVSPAPAVDETAAEQRMECTP